MFVTVFTSARHLSLPQGRPLQSTASHCTSLTSILILHIIYTWIFLQISAPKFSMHFSRTHATVSAISFPLRWSPEWHSVAVYRESPQCALPSTPPFTSSLVSTHIFSSTLFLNTLSLCSFLNIILLLLAWKNKSDEMGKTHETLGRYHNCIQSFGRKTRRTETIWKTKAHMEEQANITYDQRLSACSATCFGYKFYHLHGTHNAGFRTNDKLSFTGFWNL